jgi:AraC-like DNA-binding protein
MEQGMGLGLPLTRQIVTLHGGSMTLESQMGMGSTFHIYLPLPNLSGHGLTITTTSRPALLVIAAEHQPDTTISEIAQRQGLAIRPLQVSDDVAAALIEVQPIALAWNLAQANPADWNLFQQVRGQPRLFQLPVILYHHGAGTMGDPNLGITSVVLKPLTQAKLVDSIRRVLTKEKLKPILLIDADLATHELYQRLIAEYLPGYVVHSAKSVHEATGILAQEIPGLVIIDPLVSERDGFELIESLRSNPQTRDIPMVVISEHLFVIDELQQLDHGRIIYHGKGILTDTEAMDVIWRALSQSDPLAPQTSMLVKQAVAYMQQHYAEPLSRQEIANAVGVNPDYLTRIFRRELSVSPWDYLNRYRIKQARVLLRTTHTAIATIATEVGFAEPAYFSRVFQKEVGCSPRAFRERP